MNSGREPDDVPATPCCAFAGENFISKGSIPSRILEACGAYGRDRESIQPAGKRDDGSRKLVLTGRPGGAHILLRAECADPSYGPADATHQLPQVLSANRRPQRIWVRARPRTLRKREFSATVRIRLCGKAICSLWVLSSASSRCKAALTHEIPGILFVITRVSRPPKAGGLMSGATSKAVPFNGQFVFMPARTGTR